MVQCCEIFQLSLFTLFKPISWYAKGVYKLAISGDSLRNSAEPTNKYEKEKLSAVQVCSE